VLTLGRHVAIVGTGFSRVARHSDVPVGALAIEAIRAAVSEAGLGIEDIDGLSVYPSPSRRGAGRTDGVDFVGLDYVAASLDLKNLRWSCSTEPKRGSFVGSIIEAVNALAVGACDCAVVWRAMHNPVGRFGRYTTTQVVGPEQFLAPYGLAVPVAQWAMVYSQYMARYGARRDHMATFIVNNRRNASLNPEGIFYERPVSAEEYLTDRMVADPLSVLDCDMPVDGCGAVVLTRLDRAAHLSQPPVCVVGYGVVGVDPVMAPWYTLEGYQRSAAQLAVSLWASCGLAAGDVDQAHLYDGFSFFTYLLLEAFGFCKPGEAFEFIQNGRIGVGGQLPLNTSGGSLGMGRLHGPPQVIEAVRQLQGRCGERQCQNVEIVLATSGIPMFGGGAIILAREPLGARRS
jgi:acetyl-CoA acetyltransferase